MTGRVHPSVMNFLWIGTDGDVFRDHGVFCTSLGDALFQRRFTWELMRKYVLARQEAGVLACGCGQSVIPLEGLQSGRSSLTVSCIEKLSLVC